MNEDEEAVIQREREQMEIAHLVATHEFRRAIESGRLLFEKIKEEHKLSENIRQSQAKCKIL